MCCLIYRAISAVSFLNTPFYLHTLTSNSECIVNLSPVFTLDLTEVPKHEPLKETSKFTIPGIIIPSIRDPSSWARLGSSASSNLEIASKLRFCTIAQLADEQAGSTFLGRSASWATLCLTKQAWFKPVRSKPLSTNVHPITRFQLKIDHFSLIKGALGIL